MASSWYPLLEALLSSPAARPAVDAWYPPLSGVRERMAAVHAAHPDGFRPTLPSGAAVESIDGDVAEWELRRHQTLQRAKRKLRALARVMRMYEAKKAQAAPELSVLDVVD